MARVHRMTVEHADNPLGIDVSRPRFGWTLDAPGRGWTQSAYTIRVYRAGAVDWDSGPVHRPDSLGIRYAGRPLMSRTRYHWMVRVYDGAGRAGPWSASAWFETALLAAGDWSAGWIRHAGYLPSGSA